MGYMPKVVRAKMNFKEITDDEIIESCARKSEMESVKRFYEKLDGAELYLSLWDYDNQESYHLTSWENDIDNLVMEAIFIIESEFGSYSDFDEFEKDWKEGKYEPDGIIVFPKSCVEELEVIREVAKK